MNTERSDEFIKSWEKQVNPLKTATFTCERTFRTSPEKLFPLLCPTTEYDWIPGWSRELLHSSSGYAEYGAVFRTSFLVPEEIWVCTRYEPHKAVEYARTSNGMVGKLDISFTDNLDGTVTGRWVVSSSALVEGMNQVVAQVDTGRERFEGLLNLLEHYVNSGEMRS